MNCEDARIYLTPYLDGELQAIESLHVHEHIDTCLECQHFLDEEHRLRSALRDPVLYARASPGLALRIQNIVQEAAKEKRAPRRAPLFGFFTGGIPGWIPAAAMAVIVVGIGGLLTLRDLRTSPPQNTADGVVAGHIRSLQADHLVDAPSSDRHTVKPWFQGRLDFSPPVPDLSDFGWTLLGGRLDYLDGRPVAALVYERRMHKINVFLWPNQSMSEDNIQQENAQGYQILHWTGASMTYWVVSDLNMPELTEFAHALRGH